MKLPLLVVRPFLMTVAIAAFTSLGTSVSTGNIALSPAVEDFAVELYADIEVWTAGQVTQIINDFLMTLPIAT